MLEEREPFDIDPEWIKTISKNVKNDWPNYLKKNAKNEKDRMKQLEEMRDLVERLRFKVVKADKEVYAVVDKKTLKVSSGMVLEVYLWGKYLSSPQARWDYLTRVVALILHYTICKHFIDDKEAAFELAKRVFEFGKYGHMYSWSATPLYDVEMAAGKYAPEKKRDELEKARAGRFLPEDLCPRCRFRKMDRGERLCSVCLNTEYTCPDCGHKYFGFRCQPCYDSVKICDDCGGKYTGDGYSGSCDACYARRWDEGFQSTSEHAYEIGHNDLNRTINKKLTKKTKKSFEKAIREIMGEWDTAEWLCTKCDAVRIKGSDDLDTDKTIEELFKPCPECKAEGYLEHVVEGKYFH